MREPPDDGPASPSSKVVARVALSGPLRATVRMLAQARWYAEDVRWNLWDFAVEVREVLRCGVCLSDLRWLVANGLAEHADEITAPPDQRRRFKPTAPGSLTLASCFVITDIGMRLADDGRVMVSPVHPLTGESQAPTPPSFRVAWCQSAIETQPVIGAPKPARGCCVEVGLDSEF